MTDDLQQRIDRIKVKASMLLSKYQSEKQLRLETQSRVEALEDEVDRQRHTIELMKREMEMLKVSSVLTPDHRDVEQTRAFLAGLVREIDKCINFLSH